MSATGVLRDVKSPTSRFLRDKLNHLSTLVREANKEIQAANLQTRKKLNVGQAADLIGNAVDIRIRAFFSNDFHLGAAVKKGVYKLVFDSGRTYQGGPIQNPWYKRRGSAGAIEAPVIEEFQAFVETISPCRAAPNPKTEDALCRFCLLLAYIEGFYHGSLRRDSVWSFGRYKLPRLLQLLDEDAVEDILELSSAFFENNRRLIAEFKKATVGGTFSDEHLVGGADFDLIVDGCLIDIKTISKPAITSAMLQQLALYMMLDGSNEYELNSCALYLARQSHWLKIQKNEIFNGMSIEDLRHDWLAAMKNADLRPPLRTGPIEIVQTKNLKTGAYKLPLLYERGEEVMSLKFQLLMDAEAASELLNNAIARAM